MSFVAGLETHPASDPTLMGPVGPIGFDRNERERPRLMITVDLIAAARRCHRRRNMHHLMVDHSEHSASLLRLARESGVFAVQMTRLQAGDYLLNDRILVERKTHADLLASLVDGRLFPQVARLARSRFRSLMVIEGRASSTDPQVHPHSTEGALVSIAAMWRLPVFHSADAEASCRVLRFLAEQGRETGETVLARYDRKPKRLATRRLFVLQGLPGVGPALAQRLLAQLGSVERVMTAGAAELAIVRGIGSKRAARIREIVSP